MKDEQHCEMCGRENVCNDHHLIPKKNHSKKRFKRLFSKKEMNETILVCKEDCHRAIHRIIPDHKQLGLLYNTLEKLLSHPEIEKYVSWIQKQTKKSKF